MDSRPMKWSELRERLVAFVERDEYAPDYRELTELLADIDAAAPAMEEQEQLAQRERVRQAAKKFSDGLSDGE